MRTPQSSSHCRSRFAAKSPSLIAWNLWWTALCCGIAFCHPVGASEDLDFFEARIRPVLVKHCYECHGDDDAVEGKLRLDSRAAIRRGGETGPAVVAGQPEKSLLLRALRYQGPEMPPSGKLPENVVADFERWIRAGAADPREEAASGATAGKVHGPPVDSPESRNHWAFQPLTAPPLPEVQDPSWGQSPVDRFVLAALQGRGLFPSPPADRATLIRRLNYDLLGLPPTYEEVQAFVNDPSPDAFERLVDRLLASPQYGERWGRHWLDLARYADTKDGVLLFGNDRMRPFAYTYRDYVVRALNEDTPYDRFVHEQLAVDQLSPAVEPWRLSATGFLSVGRLFDNNLPDVYDDQIDTMCRSLLGLTTSCARCHDHKYDPIPQADYYALYGVFANTLAPEVAPQIAPADGSAAAQEYLAKEAELHQKYREHVDAMYQLHLDTARRRVGDYLAQVATTPPDPGESAVFFMSLSPEALRPALVGRWRRYIETHAVADDPVFGPWADVLAVEEPQLAARWPELQQRWQQTGAGTRTGQLNPRWNEALQGMTVATRGEFAHAFGKTIWEAFAAATAPGAVADPACDQLAGLLLSTAGPVWFPRNQAFLFMSRVERDTYHRLQREIDALAAASPAAPPRAMALMDAPQLVEPRIFLRGNPATPGAAVPRQFLAALAGSQSRPFERGSGRLELAQAITASPVAARVIVNRVWMHHFGEPLVATPSDFGLRSAPPVQQGLLDWLAHDLIAQGWSLKALHRRLVLSSTWQQSSRDREACRQVDPENRLLWRAQRRRLDLEAMRDTLLAAAARLDPAIGGRPAPLVTQPENARRTLYGLIDRQDLPSLYRAFDFASADLAAERRPLTTTPQQALFGLNSPHVRINAAALADRSLIGSGDPATAPPSPTARLTTLYRLALARDPRPEELSLGLEFVSTAAPEPGGVDPWTQWAQVLLLTNEMMFVD